MDKSYEEDELTEEYVDAYIDDSNFIEDMIEAEEEALCSGFEETLILDLDELED